MFSVGEPVVQKGYRSHFRFHERRRRPTSILKKGWILKYVGGTRGFLFLLTLCLLEDSRVRRVVCVLSPPFFLGTSVLMSFGFFRSWRVADTTGKVP